MIIDSNTLQQLNKAAENTAKIMNDPALDLMKRMDQKSFSIIETLEENNKIIHCVEESAAISKFLESPNLNRIEQLDSKFFSAFETLQRDNNTFQHINKTAEAFSKICSDSAFENFKRMTQNSVSAMEALQLNNEKIQRLGEIGSALSELVREPAWKSLSQMVQNNTFAATASAEALAASQAFGAMSSMIEQFEKPLRLFKIPNIERHIENVLSQAHSFDPSIWDDVRSFDLSRVDIRDDGVVVCDGETYDSNEFKVALNEQTQLARKPTYEKNIILIKTILRLACFASIFLASDSDTCNKFIDLSNYIYVAFEILNIPSTIKSGYNTIFNLLEKLGIKERRCRIINEHSALRADASIDAEELLFLTYGTQLQVLDEIPCWYLVKFTDKNEKVTIGWIPTEHVKNEHQIKQ